MAAGVCVRWRARLFANFVSSACPDVRSALAVVGPFLLTASKTRHTGLLVAAALIGWLAVCWLLALSRYSQGALSATFGGAGQEFFNAAILAIAVVMLTWHNVWMARHGRQLASEMRAIGEDVVAG